MKRIFQLMAAAVVLVASPLAFAGVVVIANPAVKTDTLTTEQLTQLYMGRTSTLPDGTKVAPVDLAEGSSVRVQFLEGVVGKSEQQFRGYWTRQVFTGKGQPPRTVASDAEVIRLVGSGTGFVGYVDSTSVSPKVKVLYRMD